MRCVYLAPSGELRLVDDERLDKTSERHKLELVTEAYGWQGSPIAAIDRDPTIAGLVLEMYLGWVGRDRIAVARAARRRRRRVWVYWPSEQVVECVDRERLKSYRRHWLFLNAYRHTVGIRDAASEFKTVLRREWRGTREARSQTPAWRRPFHVARVVFRAVVTSLGKPELTEEMRARAAASRVANLDRLLRDAAPVAFPELSVHPNPRHPVSGCGVYLRLDFWRPIESAGGAARTCDVANALAAVTEQLVCFVPRRINALDGSGLRQVVLDPPIDDGSENQLVVATRHYYNILRPAIEALCPRYIYEPLCIGNHAGALLSQSLKIPYFVEYGGSELVTRLAFDGGRYIYEDEYLKAEALALKQATIVSVVSAEVKADLVDRGVDECKAFVNADGADASDLFAFLARDRDTRAAAAEPSRDAPQPDLRRSTGDLYKDETRRQWDNDPAGSQFVTKAQPHTLDWFLEVEAHRYGVYAPWMLEAMEFDRHGGRRVLELGGGMGTDLAQFARHGSIVTDLDLSSGHLELAEENFSLRGLSGEFILQDAERLPFEDHSFDVVYSNGVLHHTPNTCLVVDEIQRVLKPGGKVIVMVYAENSLHYWRNLVWQIGLKQEQLLVHSMGEIMSRAVERSDNAAARPLVKAYTRAGLRERFKRFENIEVVQRQMAEREKPWLLARVPIETLGRLTGWNLILKATKRHR